jgi:hypothetical protein
MQWWPCGRPTDSYILGGQIGVCACSTLDWTSHVQAKQVRTHLCTCAPPWPCTEEVLLNNELSHTGNRCKCTVTCSLSALRWVGEGWIQTLCLFERKMQYGLKKSNVKWNNFASLLGVCALGPVLVAVQELRLRRCIPAERLPLCPH